MLKNAHAARAIAEDYRTAELPDRARAILDYAVKLTKNPSTMSEEDIRTLRQQGLSDSEILDTCQVTAYYNYVNRIADGLGVELESYWERIPHQ